jgi:hypothetical protein
MFIHDLDAAKAEYRAASAAFNAHAKPATIEALRADIAFRTAQKRVAAASNEMQRLGIR